MRKRKRKRKGVKEREGRRHQPGRKISSCYACSALLCSALLWLVLTKGELEKYRVSLSHKF